MKPLEGERIEFAIRFAGFSRSSLAVCSASIFLDEPCTLALLGRCTSGWRKLTSVSAVSKSCKHGSSLAIGKACKRMALRRPSYVAARTSPPGAGCCTYCWVGLMSLEGRLCLCVPVRPFKRWGKQTRRAEDVDRSAALSDPSWNTDQGV